MRFSIVTITMNPGAYLSEAMASVLGQNFRDLEYILVDGGSTDGSLADLRRYADSDYRVSWSFHPSAGISDAMNHAVRQCRGEIVAFLHADDRYADAEVLGTVDRLFRDNPEAMWLTGGVREIDMLGNTIRSIPVRSFSYRRLLRNNIIFHPATFVRRECFARFGLFDDGLTFTMDYDLWLRIGHVYRPIEVQSALADFRVHKGSLSSSNKMAVLDEEYKVRCRYTAGRMGRLGHHFYHFLRRRMV